MPDLDLMVASKELDELVGTTIFKMWTSDEGDRGVIWYQPNPRDPLSRWYANVGLRGGQSWFSCLPRFSSDLAAAWLIIDKMKNDGYSFALWDVPGFSSVQPGPTVAFKAHSVYPPEPKDTKAMGYTVPLAICLAALVTLGVIVVKENQYARS